MSALPPPLVLTVLPSVEPSFFVEAFSSEPAEEPTLVDLLMHELLDCDGLILLALLLAFDFPSHT